MSSDLQRRFSKAACLDDSDIDLLASSKHIEELRDAKKAGGRTQAIKEEGMKNVFDRTSLDEQDFGNQIVKALEQTEDLNQDPTIETSEEMGVVLAVRSFLIAVVLNRYVVENIKEISETETKETFKRRKAVTIQSGSQTMARRIAANEIINKLAGRLLELEEEDIMTSDVDPHLAYVILTKEIEVLEIIKVLYGKRKDSIPAQNIAKEIDEITRPKIQSLLADLDQIVAPKKRSNHKEKIKGKERTSLLKQLTEFFRKLFK